MVIISQNIPLKPYTSFKLGGPARFFCTLNSIKDIEEILDFIEKNKINFFILGGGTNILVKDEGFDGIVIKPGFNYLNFFDDGRVIVGASTLMPYLVYESCKLGYRGLEWAGGLPGTIGGAIRGNAGCFGFEIKDCVKSVKAINLKNQEFKIFEKDDLNFGYRYSFFKENSEWLIIEIELQLIPNQNRDELLKIMNEKIEYRKKNHPLEYPNAGSIFKNLNVNQVPEEVYILAKEKNKIKDGKIPTAFLIEELGLKGKQIGGAKISEKHANFIVNLGYAKTKDVLDLIQFIKEKVYEKFKVTLEEEIQIV